MAALSEPPSVNDIFVPDEAVPDAFSNFNKVLTN
jgi:hypothetical protein